MQSTTTNMLPQSSRMVWGTAVLLLILTYFLPLWKIHLQAPQYPEGMGLDIYISRIRGENKNDLDNINRLNHYIGMKEILPDQIPELKFMPWLIAGMIVIGLAGTVTGYRWILTVWILLFLVLLLAGLVDFYQWEYEYGHNLSPDAPIKVPGMSYQPPLLGSKKLLNITAISFPGSGGLFAFLSLLTGLSVWFWERKKRPGKKPASGLKASLLLVSVIGWGSIIPGCSPGPSPIDYGHDMCVTCQMIISDRRYGAELVTDKGKVYKFDSVECLAVEYLSGRFDPGQIHSRWVVDFERGEQLIEADKAVYLHSRELRSPMGMGLTAFTGEASARRIQQTYSGNLLNWSEVLELVRTGKPAIFPSDRGRRRPLQLDMVSQVK